MRYMDLTYDLQ